MEYRPRFGEEKDALQHVVLSLSQTTKLSLSSIDRVEREREGRLWYRSHLILIGSDLIRLDRMGDGEREREMGKLVRERKKEGLQAFFWLRIDFIWASKRNKKQSPSNYFLRLLSTSDQIRSDHRIYIWFPMPFLYVRVGIWLVHSLCHSYNELIHAWDLYIYSIS